jgi:hypothetical protein
MLFDRDEQVKILKGELISLTLDIEKAFRDMQVLTRDIHETEKLRKGVRKMIDDLEAL